MEHADRDDLAAVARCHHAYDRIRAELAKVIVGQHWAIERVLVAAFAGGHVLLESAPGLAKTLLFGSLAETMGLSFKRIQLTPDLSPGDVIGAEVVQEDPATLKRQYQFRPGPIFAHMVLADEIDRTPPKTQAAVLEAAQERQVSVGAQVHRLADPFFLLAVQSPPEQEGTCPLRVAQLDYFLLSIKTDYPTGQEEWDIARLAASGRADRVGRVVTAEEVLGFRQLVTRVPMSDHVLGYAWALVRASRPASREAPELVDKWMAWGAGPRGMLALLSCAKARAVLHGRYEATIDDVQAMVGPVLRHRIAGNYAAQANALTNDRLIQMLLEAVPADRQYEGPGARWPED
jgi:MoxR-like ATPase